MNEIISDSEGQNTVQPARFRLFFWAAMAIFLGLLLWHYHGTMVRAFRSSPEHGLSGIDSTGYIRSAQEIAKGRPPMMFGIPHGYPYPLTLAWVLIPIAHLPYGVAQSIWFLIQVASGAIAIGLVLRDAQRFSLIKINDILLFAFAIAFAINYEIPQSHLRNGQANALLLLCCILAYYFHWRCKPILSAAILGFGVGLKYFPLVMMPYFFLRKQFGICVNAILFAVLFACIPALWMGDSFVESYAFLMPNGFWSFFKSSHAQAPLYFSLYRTVGFFFPTALDMVWPRFLCFLIIIAPLAWIDWRGTDYDPRNQKPHDIYTVCLWLAAFNLVSPHAQAHYLVFLMPGLALTIARAFQTRRKDEIIMLCAYMPLHFLGMHLNEYPVFFASILLIYVLLFLQRFRIQQERALSPEMQLNTLTTGA